MHCSRQAELYQKVVELFEGDISAARKWLQSPNKSLGNVSPLELAESEKGARAVEDLIGRLQHGVFN